MSTVSTPRLTDSTPRSKLRTKGKPKGKTNTRTYIIIGVVIVVILIVIGLIYWYWTSGDDEPTTTSTDPTTPPGTTPPATTPPATTPPGTTPPATMPPATTPPATTPTTPTTPAVPTPVPVPGIDMPWTWTREQRIRPFGPGHHGNPAYSMSCTDGSYVSLLHGRAGSKLDSFELKCSNDATFGRVGGTGGDDYPLLESEEGFNKARIRWTDAVNMVQLFGTESGELPAIGQDNPSKSVDHGPAEVSDCGPDGRIIGFYGNAGDTIDSMGIICGHPR